MSQSISLARPLLVTLVVAVGIAAGWGFAALWTMTVASQFGAAQAANEMLYVRVDGEPFIVRSSIAHGGQQVLTLDGQPAAVDQQLLLYPHYSYPAGSQRWDGALDWSRRITSANDGGAPAVYWYLVHDGRPNGRAYGVGYHASTRLIAGYFSRQGFSEQMPPRDDWFEIEGAAGLVSATTAVYSWEPQTALSNEFTLLADQKLWIIDVRGRTVKAIADVSGPAALSQAWQLLNELPDTPRTAHTSATGWIEQKWLLRERERITLIDPDSGESRLYPLPEDLQSAYFGVFALANGKLLIATDGDFSLAGQSPGSLLITLDAEGNIVERKAFRLARRSGASEREVAWASIIVAPMLVATALLTTVMQYSLVRQGTAASLAEALPQTLAWLWPVLLVVAIIGLIAAVAAYRRQRRFALPHAGMWAAFAFLFGVPGWLAYRYHRTWPPLAACPSCKQSTPRDRVACSDCGATFPPPPLKGIEVYA